MTVPLVSIILPTYNRARFLPQAFESIRAQTLQDWELIVVDDGSTDETQVVLETWPAQISQSVRCICQPNGGAYPARHTGLQHAVGKYVAFFDSDDLWLPHHLMDCAQGLEAQSEVDWVYGASRIVDESTGTVLVDNSFYEAGKPRPFLKLSHRQVGKLTIIEDGDVIRCMILHGLYCGLQNSVIRRGLLDRIPIATEYWNEAEDQLMVIRSLAAGCRFAYFDNVHVLYRIHDANSCATGSSLPRSIRVYQACIRGFEDLAHQVTLSGPEKRALRRRLNREYFWHLGYSLLWQNGRPDEAFAMFRRGLRAWPWDWRCWKTLIGALVRRTWSPEKFVAVGEGMGPTPAKATATHAREAGS